MRRRGWTLHEMLISLGVMSAVVALVAHMATGQLRFFRGVGEVVALRSQIGHANAIAASLLWSLSPSGGDIVAALDSAIEMQIPVGTAVACASASGRVTIPAPAASPGNTLAAFMESPEAGDRAIALFEDTLGATWLTLHVAAPPAGGTGCVGWPSVTATLNLALQEPVTVPAGATLRFTRPLRLSLYRASDDRWYLGAKSWNNAAQRFNTIQPVAGPLRPYSSNPARTGFLLLYRDVDAAPLSAPFETSRVASVTIVSRAQSIRPVRVAGLSSTPGGGYEDSSAVTVSLRNSR